MYLEGRVASWKPGTFKAKVQNLAQPLPGCNVLGKMKLIGLGFWI